MKYLGGVGVKVAVIGLGTSAADVMLPEGTTELLACCRRSLLLRLVRGCVDDFEKAHGRIVLPEDSDPSV